MDIDKLILNQADFDYIRVCVEDLKLLVKEFGPFNEFSRDEEGTYNPKCGWECADLEKLDPKTIWTEFEDDNGCYLTPGYHKKDGLSVELVGWFVASKVCNQERAKDWSFLRSVYLLQVFDPETDDHLGSSAVNLFNLVHVEDMSNKAIVTKMDFSE
jgi:hypothetical protein